MIKTYTGNSSWICFCSKMCGGLAWNVSAREWPRLTSSMRTALEDLEPDTEYGMQYLEAIQSAASLPSESAA